MNGGPILLVLFLRVALGQMLEYLSAPLDSCHFENPEGISGADADRLILLLLTKQPQSIIHLCHPLFSLAWPSGCPAWKRWKDVHPTSEAALIHF